MATKRYNERRAIIVEEIELFMKLYLYYKSRVYNAITHKEME